MSEKPNAYSVASAIAQLLGSSGLSKTEQKKALGLVATEFSSRLTPIGVPVGGTANPPPSATSKDKGKVLAPVKKSNRVPSTPPSSSIEDEKKVVLDTKQPMAKASYNLDPEVVEAEAFVKRVRKDLTTLLSSGVSKDSEDAIGLHRDLTAAIAAYKAAKLAAKSRLSGSSGTPPTN